MRRLAASGCRSRVTNRRPRGLFEAVERGSALRERVAAAQLADAGSHEAQLLAERREKVERLRAAGIEPYQGKFPDRTAIAAVHATHGDLTEPGDHPDLSVRVAGRMTARRGHGKTTFMDVIDGSGTIQVYA